MTSQIPSYAQLKEYIELKIRSVSDVSSLSRTIIKDSVAQKFNLTSKERERLDTDKNLKSSIKSWINEAIDALPAQASSTSELKKVESKKTPEKKVEKPTSNQSSQRRESMESSKSKLEIKPRSESSKSTTPIKPTSESNSKRKLESENKSSKEVKVSKNEEEKAKAAQKDKEALLDELSSMDESEEDEKKKKSRPKKKARSSTSTLDSTSKNANGEENNSKVKASTKAVSSSSADTSENGLAKTEAKLKKLKKLVALCGTRKLWKKLYEEAGCPDVEGDTNIVNVYEKLQKQVRVVELVLKDLGMSTPFTQAKADAIREKKELEEDKQVIMLANTTERSTTRRSKENKKRDLNEAVDEESMSTDAPEPKAKQFSRYLSELVADINDE